MKAEEPKASDLTAKAMLIITQAMAVTGAGGRGHVVPPGLQGSRQSLCMAGLKNVPYENQLIPTL